MVPENRFMVSLSNHEGCFVLCASVSLWLNIFFFTHAQAH
jgi:hypothetical protein